MRDEPDFAAAYAALDPDRWKCAQADAIALVTRQHYLGLKAAGVQKPQVAVAEVREVSQQNVSRAVARGEGAAHDPERYAAAFALARAAGVDLELLYGNGS